MTAPEPPGIPPAPSATPPALPSERKTGLVSLLSVNGALFAVLIMTLLFKVPVFIALFAGFGKPLPAATQFLIDLSRAVKTWWWLVVLTAGGSLFGGFLVLERLVGRTATRRGLMVLAVLQCLFLVGMMAAIMIPLFQLSVEAAGK